MFSLSSSMSPDEERSNICAKMFPAQCCRRELLLPPGADLDVVVVGRCTVFTQTNTHGAEDFVFCWVGAAGLLHR